MKQESLSNRFFWSRGGGVLNKDKIEHFEKVVGRPTEVSKPKGL